MSEPAKKMLEHSARLFLTDQSIRIEAYLEEI